jgi:hydroxypyruvate isomerase
LIAELRFDANLRWLFTELPFEERFDAAAAAGFTAVEYASPYPWPAAVLKGRLTDAGLTQILINSR